MGSAHEDEAPARRPGFRDSGVKYVSSMCWVSFWLDIICQHYIWSLFSKKVVRLAN